MIPAWLIPYAISGAIGAAVVGGGVWYVQEQRYDRASAERDSAVKDLGNAIIERDNWIKSANIYTDTIALMSAEAERQRADLAQAEAILRTADDLARQEAADLNAEIAKWKRLAHDRPQDVRPVGPIALGAWCQRMRLIGQVPAGCPAAD